MSFQARLQAASAEFQKLQSDLSNIVEARQRLDAQLSENELVRKEFQQLTSANVVFKLTGPVLVKQDHGEAKSNVETRLDFIRSEIKRVEAQLKDVGEKQEKKRLELVEIQTALQEQQAQQVSTPSKHSPALTA